MLYFKMQHTGRILRLRPIFSEVQVKFFPRNFVYKLLHILTKYKEKVVYRASFYFENYFSEIKCILLGIFSDPQPRNV